MQPSLPVLVTVVGLPFAAAALVPLVHRRLGDRTGYYGAAIAAACLVLLLSQAGTEGAISLPWSPTLGISLTLLLDGLSLLIGLLASGIGVLIFAYSRSYMHGEPNQMRYYAALLAFMGSMLGVALAGDLIALFVFWELTSVTSFVLIGHYRHESASMRAARTALMITVAGGLFMLIGFLALHAVAGSYDLVWLLEHADTVRGDLRASGTYVPIIALLGIGAAAKSAQVPLHIWLPGAMEAPTPVSAFLHSATMVKAGVYLVGRFRPLLTGEEWALVFVTMGLLTMAVTAILAVQATDIKELLAYSTASHLGLIIAGFGFAPALGEAAATYGGEAGAFHILNHALFKAALFLVAGIVAHEAGTRAIDELGGLGRELPFTAGIAGIAALGMAGIPPFNGFYSKELLFKAAYDAAAHTGGVAWVLPVVAVGGSVFTVLYSLRFLWLFLGGRRAPVETIHRPPAAMLVPAGILAGLALLVGLVPELAIDVLIGRTVEAVGGQADFHVGIPTSASPPAVMSAITIGLGVVAFPAYGRLHGALGRLLRVDPLRAGWYFDGLLGGLEGIGTRSTRLQTGRLRTYAYWTLGTTSALALFGYLAAGLTLPVPDQFGVSIPTAVLLLVVVGGALATIRADSHVAGVLSLSVLGLAIAVFYVFANAPDLALTQLVVETLVLVIFLLVLDKLPAFYGEIKGWRSVRDGVLSLVVGVTVGLTVLVSTAAVPAESIDRYFVEHAIPEGGGGNVVNVILVDFRAFDTMGEISVVGMAALSILTLIAMRSRGEAP